MTASITKEKKLIKLLYSIIQSLLSSFFIFLLIIIFSGTTEAQDQNHTKSIKVIGAARVHAKDVESARNQSIANSLVSAVWLVAAEMLTIDSDEQNLIKLNDIFSNQTAKYVRDYKVLMELKSENIYRVFVQATISTDKIKEQLSILRLIPDKKAMPRILFFISEQTDDLLLHHWWGEDLTFARGAAENSLAKALEKMGLTVVDYTSGVPGLEDEILSCEPNIKNQDAVNLGLKMKADMVIIGKAGAHKTNDKMGEKIKSFKGTITARVLRTDTSGEVAATVQTAMAVNGDEIAGINEVLSIVGNLAGENLGAQIIAAWQEKVKIIKQVKIEVQGTRDLASFVKFRRFLKEISDIKSLQVKEMKSDEAVIIVNYQGNTKNLTASLMLKTFKSFDISIHQLSQTHLKVELIPGKGL